MSFNWEDLRSNTIGDLRREAIAKGIEVPPKATKFQIINLLTQKVEPTTVSSRLLQSSESSERNSPTPAHTTKQNFNNSPNRQSPKPETPSKSKQPNDTPSASNTKEEEREQSPLLPSKRSAKKSTPKQKPTETTPQKQESPISYNYEASPNYYKLPHNLIVMNYVSGGFCAFFAIFGLLQPFCFIPAFILGILFYFVHTRLGDIVGQRANSLATKIVARLKTLPNGECQKKALMETFQSDRFLMTQVQGMLVAGGRVSIHKRKDQGEVWRLEQ
ncbi:hypothetical protein TRFO_28555 [Tritrichomonas foetus]|uniref:Uncharacterized protein n=1 Tax=Tritrichomonas foetus TaxID=1144522 RepID=A0A1J4JZV2_9EUKA|nr:hypothetical protein TRFO_28555 [Tritrichomonas foetus]|eukprot:OHT04016.1 hypothetical protein TRFO_28555 [Tritrichomonas foetus]